MDQFALLGSVAARLHHELSSLYYVLLPVFFALALAIDWFKHPQGSPDFIETLKRAFIATILLAGFAEITDVILFISNGLAAKIDDLNGIDSLMQMAGEKAKTYTLSVTSIILAFNDLLVAALAFLSYIILYLARYIMVATYHFSWIFLTITAPILLLFHVFTPKLTVNLFRSLIEVASWKIVWSVLSVMLSALPYGNAYMADGNYLTVIVLNFVIALCMLGTPLVVHSLVGSGLSGMTGALPAAVAATMAGAPGKAISAFKAGREVLTNTKNYAAYQAHRVASGTKSFLSPPPGKSDSKADPSSGKNQTPTQNPPRESSPPPPTKK